jgi:hypothetical protein
MADVTIHLLAFKPGVTVRHLSEPLEDALVKGIPHGWVHKPHDYDSDQLLAHKWDFFVVTEQHKLPESAHKHVESSINITIQIPKDQYEQLKARKAKEPMPSSSTPPLPQAWQAEKIPRASIIDDKSTNLDPGELRLDQSSCKRGRQACQPFQPLRVQER